MFSYAYGDLANQKFQQETRGARRALPYVVCPDVGVWRDYFALAQVSSWQVLLLNLRNTSLLNGPCRTPATLIRFVEMGYANHLVARRFLF